MTNKNKVCWNEDISRQEALHRYYFLNERPETCCAECEKELQEFLIGHSKDKGVLKSLIPEYARGWFE